MSHDLVLDILERVLEAARLVLDERDEPGVMVDDLRGLVGALDLTLRRYRRGIAQTSASGDRLSCLSMAIVRVGT